MNRARRSMRTCSIAALVLGLAAPAACADARDPSWEEVGARIAREFPDVRGVSTETLASWLEAERPVVLLDARSAAEFRVSHLPGAHHAPDAATAARVLVGLEQDSTVVAYCSVGVRSARLVQELGRRSGVSMLNLEGSIFAWANEGRPVVRDGARVRDVHPYDASWGLLLDPALRTDVPRAPASEEARP